PRRAAGIADDRFAGGPDHDRGVEPDAAVVVHGAQRLVLTGAAGVVATGDLQIHVGRVEVADHRIAVGADRERAEFPDDARPVDGRQRLAPRDARGIVAARDLQIVVRDVVVADDRVSVGAERERAGVADEAGRVDRALYGAQRFIPV